MNRVLREIRATLRHASGIDYVRSGDIFITPHLGFLPTGVRSPFIAIKDGPVETVELTGGVIERRGRVHLAAFVDLAKPEASVVGDTVTSSPGVVDVVGDIRETLAGNLLGLDHLQAALVAAEGESEMFLDERGTGFQRKTITMLYIWEE